MRIRLWLRLFILFAGLSIAGLLAVVMLQQRQFERGFLAYVNQLNLAQLESATARLATYYRDNNGWENLRHDRRTFSAIVSGQAFDQSFPPKSGDHPPPGEPGNARSFDDRPLPGNENRSGPPMRGPPPEPPMQARLSDASNQWVAGRRDVPDDAPAIDITVDGTVVGRLQLAPLPQLNRGIDIEFARSQARQAVLIAAGVLLAALVLAWTFANSLLKPIAALARGTRSLTAGEYALHIADERSDELGDLARNFNSLADVLKKNAESRQRWGADIAHELRTPLTILSGELHALLDGIRPVNRDALASLAAEIERMSGLVEDLNHLALSDAGALEYRFAIINLNEVLSEALHTQQTVLAQHASSITIALAQPMLTDGKTNTMLVRADAGRLRQLWMNLLLNSTRYTDRPGRIEITAAREADDWRIDIDDTAPGVPTEALPKLFDRLYRVDPSRQRVHGKGYAMAAAAGSGLGLAIAKNIVEAHGGRIVASASTLGGLRMSVWFPVERAENETKEDTK